MGGLKFFPLVPILGETNSERQITVDETNVTNLSEKGTFSGLALAFCTAWPILPLETAGKLDFERWVRALQAAEKLVG
jgi:hypothetical protein